MDNYCRQYQLKSLSNEYLIKFQSVEKKNETKLNITIIHYILKNEILYYSEKTLKEIHQENNFLSEFRSITSLIDYLSYRTKNDDIIIDKQTTLFYTLIVLNNTKNQEAKFLLVRKLGESLEKEIINLNKKIESLSNIIKGQRIQLKAIENDTNRISYDQKFKEIEKIEKSDNNDKISSSFNVKENPIIDSNKNNPIFINNNNNIFNLNKNEDMINNINLEDNEKNIPFNENNNSNNNFNFMQNTSKSSENNIIFNSDINKDEANNKDNEIINEKEIKNYNDEDNFNNNSSIIGINHNMNDNQEVINSIYSSNQNTMFKENMANNDNENKHNHNIFKENNNEIAFQVIPKVKDNKIIISKEKEICSIFTAFNIQNGQSIIAWVTENRSQEINIKNLNNLNNEEKYCCIKAHESRIISIKYFHNENISEKNDYIISLSENDEQTIKLWLLVNMKYLEFTNIIIKKSERNKNIIEFCSFNNKYYSKNNSYFFIYEEDISNNKNNNIYKNKDILCYKLDNQFKKLQWENDNNENNEKNNYVKEISNYERINYLDTFYYEKTEMFYLIICNNKEVIVRENPLTSNRKIYFFKKNNDLYHSSAFIVERKNNLELFDSNKKGIFIWDINNNNNCKIYINLSYTFTYDLCLWNDDYLWASTQVGLQLLKINDNNKQQFEKVLECLENTTYKTASKIRKIDDPKLGYCIIALDSNNSLCLWKIKKNN